MKKTFRTIFIAGIGIYCLLTSLVVNAQEDGFTPVVVDTINGKIENVKSDVDLFKRFKVTGYIQAQWQIADTIGAVTPFSGGAFPKYSDNRFAVRRGRVKFAYENEFSNFVLQLDATEKGVSLKDAYIAVREPWKQFVTLTAGVFDRPFGYEISYSSSNRETPERSRVFQTLFPGERDLGAKITLQPMKGSRFDWIRLDAGLFVGNGINPEYDTKKDFIGRLGMSKANRKETMKFGLGISGYYGSVLQLTKYKFEMSDAKSMVVDSTSSNIYEFANRRYIGVDGQFSIESFLGFTTLRAEYITGLQPGLPAENTSPAFSESSLKDIYTNIDTWKKDNSKYKDISGKYATYLRNFSGGYVYLIQNVGHTKHQLVVKYDWLDPNSKVAGTDIAKAANLSKADIKYSTIGLGWNYRFNSHIRFTTYYEMVKNEETGIKGTNSTDNYAKDLKDNVLTLRVQYKF